MTVSIYEHFTLSEQWRGKHVHNSVTLLQMLKKHDIQKSEMPSNRLQLCQIPFCSGSKFPLYLKWLFIKLSGILSAGQSICKPDLTNLSKLPPQISCYCHFLNNLLLQVNSSLCTKNRTTESAKLNGNNLTLLKYSELPSDQKLLNSNCSLLKTFIASAKH